MRTAKILSLIVGGLVGLIATALLAVWLLVNPNDFKPRISAAVKKATGRDLVLTGDIKLSVFPWIALQLGPASLGNPPGFNDQPFLSFNRAAVRLRLVPLLSKRLDVGRVEIDGLDLKLLKNAEGRGNWQDFGKSSPAASAPAPEPTAGHTSAGESLQGIAGISVTHSRVSFEDMTVENIKFETGSFSAKGAVPVTLHLDAKRAAGESASLDARFDFSADSTDERLALAALNFDGAATLAGNPRPIRWKLAAPAVDVDMGKQTLQVPKFAVTAAGAELSGSIDGTHIIDAPTVTGSVTLAPLIVREFLPRLGATAPVTRDPKAVSSVSASAHFAYGGNAVRVHELSATLDDTHLKGSLSANLESRALTFELAVDRIDLDRYLPPATTAPAPTPAPVAAAPPALNAEGTLSVGSVHFAPLDLSAVKVTLAAKDGVMHVHPLTAQIYGGQYSGDITLDSRATMALSMDEHLSGVDVGKLMAAQSKKLHVTGHGNVNIKATGRGAGADAILKTLNGHFDANVSGGAVEGVDLGYVLAQAEGLLRHQGLSNAQNTHRTAFDAFKLSAQITNGVAETRDLVISSAVLKITGQGTANLPTQALDLALMADTLKTAGSTPIQVPVKVTGTFADPTVRPDVEALAKGQVKQKVKDVLQDKLKGIFGKP